MPAKFSLCLPFKPLLFTKYLFTPYIVPNSKDFFFGIIIRIFFNAQTYIDRYRPIITNTWILENSLWNTNKFKKLPLSLAIKICPINYI